VREFVFWVGSTLSKLSRSQYSSYKEKKEIMYIQQSPVSTNERYSRIIVFRRLGIGLKVKAEYPHTKCKNEER
jgi:hypothetical protein